MHADALAFLHGEPRQREVIEVDEAVEEISRRDRSSPPAVLR